METPSPSFVPECFATAACLIRAHLLPRYCFLPPPGRGAYPSIAAPALTSIFAIAITCSFTVASTCISTRASTSFFAVTCLSSYTFASACQFLFSHHFHHQHHHQHCLRFSLYICLCLCFFVSIASSPTCDSAAASAWMHPLQDSSGALVSGCHKIVQWSPYLCQTEIPATEIEFRPPLPPPYPTGCGVGCVCV